MISAGDFKNGLTLDMDGQVMQIVEFQHVKPGKGAAFVRTKMRNVINGGVVEKTFRPTEKFPAARIDRKDQQYLYNDGDLYYFMDPETFDQVMINKEVIGDSMRTIRSRSAPTMVPFSPSSPRSSLSWRSPTQSRALPATPRRARPSPQPLRRAPRFRCRFSSTLAIRSRSTRGLPNIFPEHNTKPPRIRGGFVIF